MGLKEPVLSEKSNIAMGFALTIGTIVFGFGITYANVARNTSDVKSLNEILPEVRERLSNIEGAIGAKKYDPRKKSNEED